MKGLLVPTVGDPQVVRGVWTDDASITKLLDCQSYAVVVVPNDDPAAQSMFFDEQGPAKQRDVNAVATELVAGRLAPGHYIAGPALIAGFDPETGVVADFNLLDLIRIGARLVRAERAALPRGGSTQ